jgi:hypothetical protein
MKKLKDLVARGRIKITDRLVTENDGRFFDKSAGYRDPLLLAPDSS